MNRFLLRSLLALMVNGGLHAAEWDARTTRTNTAVSDPDIQFALTAGMTKEFVQLYPISQFGIHVLVDRHLLPPPGSEMVYLSLGLCRRLPDGRYELAHAHYSDVVVLPPGTPPALQRQAVQQKLTQMAGGFSQGMVQRVSRLR